MVRLQVVRAIFGLALLFPVAGLAQRPLSLDEEPNREEILDPGQSWEFAIELNSGDFARLSVEPLLPEVGVVLYGPDGAEIINRTRSNINAFAETLSAIAEHSGTYRLLVSSRWPKPGRCIVRVVERRRSVATDRMRLEAEKTYDDAKRRQKGNSAEIIRSAIPMFERAMKLFRALHDDAAYADAENRLGETEMYYLGEYEKSIGHLLGALSIRQCIDDSSGRGQTLDDLGGVFRVIGHMHKALAFFQAALPDRNPEIPREVAITLRNIADTQAELADEEAIPNYLRVLDLMREAEEPIGQGYAHHSIAVYYCNRSDWQTALEHAQEALHFFRIAKHDRGTVFALLNIGMVYQAEGEPERALAYLRRAMPLSEGIPDPGIKGGVLAEIGSVLYDLHQYERAIEEQRAALKIFSALEHGTREVELLVNLGMSYAAKGDPGKALEYYQHALPIIRGLEFFGMGGRCQRAMAEAQLSLGRTGEAQASASKAIEILHGSGYAAEEAGALLTRARIEQTTGNLEAARTDAEAAISINERLRGKVGVPQKRAAYLASVWETYELYIDVLMHLHRHALALHASERARARSLVDLLAESRAGAIERAEPSQIGRLRSLRARISAKAQAQLQLVADKNSAAAEQLKGQLEDLNTQYEQLIVEMRRNNPALAAVASPEPLDLEQIQREVLDSSSVLLEYSLGEKRSFLWVVTPDGLHTYALPPRRRIESAVRAAYRGLSTLGHVEGELRSLSAMLLAPASAALGSKRLIIVPDGALQYLSFAALPSPDRQHRPLIADHEIVTLPSASAMAVLRRYPHARPSSRTLAVFADPVFDRSDSRLSARTAGSQPIVPSDSEVVRSARESGLRNLARLPFTRREATAVLSLVDPSRRKQALDFDANRRAVMDPDLANYRFVHFATHGLLNNFHPELSGIVLSMVDERGNSQDGFLSTADVFNLSWSADLVVLSGCRTGLGKEIRGEGIAGLTQAFMYAGAPRVVASLWNVNDAATAELMKRFYEGMLGPKHLAPPAALRAAQLRLQKETRWSAPYYWAAFVMQGEWR